MIFRELLSDYINYAIIVFLIVSDYKFDSMNIFHWGLIAFGLAFSVYAKLMAYLEKKY